MRYYRDTETNMEKDVCATRNNIERKGCARVQLLCPWCHMHLYVNCSTTFYLQLVISSIVDCQKPENKMISKPNQVFEPSQ